MRKSQDSAWPWPRNVDYNDHIVKNNRLLITFGCSWTYGVGVGYQSHMTKSEYKKICWDKTTGDSLSFRGLISKELGFDNISFAQGQSSNQRQIRFAKDFFTSNQFAALQQHYDQVIVIWAITSTARTEIYSVERNQIVNFKYDHTDLQLAKELIKLSYNHDYEIEVLSKEMIFWNDYFKCKKIDNLWVDTFNHHEYTPVVSNLIGSNIKSRDMLSRLAINNGLVGLDNTYHSINNGMVGLDNTYHYSSWRADSDRIKYLVQRNILNPISYHPTALGHRQIANMLIPEVKKIIR